MGWVKQISASAIKASAIKVALTKVRKNGRQTLYFSIPAALITKLWDKCDRADVYLGEAEHAGKALLQPGTAGAIKIQRLKHAIALQVPAPAGLGLERASDVCAHVKDDKIAEAFIVSLPDWFTHPRAEPVAAAPAARVSNGSALAMKGNMLMTGAKEPVPLPPAYAALMRVFLSDADHVWTPAKLGMVEGDDVQGKIDKLSTLIKPAGLTVAGDKRQGYHLQQRGA